MAPHLPDSELAAYQALVNAMPDMVIRIGKDHIFRSFEGNVEDLFWPAGVYLGIKVEDVLPDAAAARFGTALEEALAGNRVPPLEYSIHHEGTVRHYEARFVKSGPHEVAAIVRNVTREKETEEQLSEYQCSGTWSTRQWPAVQICPPLKAAAGTSSVIQGHRRSS
ncbi:MAG: PAS domain-containing protein [Desulfobacteraceae bacterium]|jgi:PAS domain-containing protein|nr:PAS domain-containing protein [Desulfobacteraceae bacterium]